VAVSVVAEDVVDVAAAAAAVVDRAVIVIYLHHEETAVPAVAPTPMMVMLG
jgi:hypothetical protein